MTLLAHVAQVAVLLVILLGALAVLAGVVAHEVAWWKVNRPGRSTRSWDGR